MKRITDTLSKEIIAAAEGEIAGIVTNLYADAKLTRLRGYKVSTDERDEGWMLPIARVLGEGDAIVIRHQASLQEPYLAECPIGAKVYDTAGACYGTLRDVCFDETSGKILCLITDEGEIAPDHTLSFGKSAVVLRAPAHEKTLFRKGTSKRAKKKRTVSATPGLPPALSSIAEEVLAERKETPTEWEGSPENTELQEGTEYAFLLGRTVMKDLGEIARASERVTPDVIRKARTLGKLVELTVNSRKG